MIFAATFITAFVLVFGSMAGLAFFVPTGALYSIFLLAAIALGILAFMYAMAQELNRRL